jgi:sugar O-acyltransferase (sialic acid O-acetyltransferase NeuD family)
VYRKRLIIVGAGNLGRELLDWAQAIPADQRDWEVGGFIDDHFEALNGFHVDVPVLSSIIDYVPDALDVLCCAIANPAVKLKVCRELERRGANFVNVIHPTCVIGSRNHIGKGLVMCPYSTISTNSTIGDFVTINNHSIVAHDTTLEDGVTLSGQCDVMGSVHIEEGAFLGSGARLLPKTRVGQYAVIGAGTVVLTDVDANRTVAGVPARYIK